MFGVIVFTNEETNKQRVDNGSGHFAVNNHWTITENTSSRQLDIHSGHPVDISGHSPSGHHSQWPLTENTYRRHSQWTLKEDTQ